MNNSNFIELTVTISTLKALEEVNLRPFTTFYLGNPFCAKLKDNFLWNLEDLKKGIRYLKENKKKVYLVTPVIPLRKDFKNIAKLLKIGAAAAIDGVEVHDMGVLRMVKNLPLPIHLGLFANVYNRETALVFQKMGAKRIIPSQELTLEEISELKKIPNLEIELPIHGKQPLGVANACLLAIYPAAGGVEFPSRRSVPCTQQCQEESFLHFNGPENPVRLRRTGLGASLKIRTKGTATFTGADLSMIEYLPLLLKENYRHFRIEGLWESPQNLSMLGEIYRRAFEEILENKFDSEESLQRIREIAAEVCNGWCFGHSGRKYLPAGKL